MVETGAGTNTPPQVNRFQKFGLSMQVFMLRRGWMGKASDFLLVITTKGRRTGRNATIPISYKMDGEEIITLNPGNSNWFKNVLAAGSAILEIKGRKFEAVGRLVTDEKERRSIFEKYRTDDPKIFERLFRIPADSPEEELLKVLSKWKFIKFTKR